MHGDGSPGRARFAFNKDTDAPLLASLHEYASVTSLRPYAQQTKPAQNVAVPATRHPTIDPAETLELIGQLDTNKSFDFTGELRKLNYSVRSDCCSFLEQLKNAFRKPAGVDLGFSVGQNLFTQEDTPIATSLPPSHHSTPGEGIVPQSVTNFDFSSFTFERSIDEFESSYRDSATSDTLDRLLAECKDDFSRLYP